MIKSRSVFRRIRIMLIQTGTSSLVVPYRIFCWIEFAFNYFLFVLGALSLKVLPRGRPPADKRKILITRLENGVGDYVLFTSSLKAYRRLFRDEHIVLLVAKQVYPLAKLNHFVDEVWWVDIKRFRIDLVYRFKWAKKMIRSAFEIAINATYSRSADYLDCIVGWTCATRRIVHECLDVYGPRKTPRPFFTELVPATSEWKFEIDRSFDMLDYLGYSGQVDYRTDFGTAVFTESGRKRRLGENGDDRYAVLLPSAGNEYKIWQQDNFIEAVRIVEKADELKWAICGSGLDNQVCDYVYQGLTRCSIRATNLAGKTSLPELVQLIKGAQFCLSNDTGAAHIAIAVGTPLIVIVGGGHFGRFFPYSNRDQCAVVTNRLPCFNCYWHCILDERECISKVQVQDVVDAVLKIKRTKRLRVRT